MKYDTALFTTLVAITVPTLAAPVQEQPSTGFTPSDPFIACIQRTFPMFPKEGKPTTEQLRACFPKAHPQAARELVAKDTKDDINSDIQSRGLTDSIQVLGKLMGLDQKSLCQAQDGVPITLHDEFVWVEDVTNAASDLCNQAMDIIDQSGLHQDGGVAWVSRQFSNGHDDQSNYLHNGRKLLLTMAIDFFPPAAIAKEQIKDVANGVRNLCSGGVSRLMDPRDGCTSEVSWYISQKAKFEKHMAAVGGQLGMYLDGSRNTVGTIRLGFSEDSN